MKIFLLLLISVLGVCLAEPEFYIPRHGIRKADPPDARARAVQWGTFQQPLDNFNASNPGRWNMRYVMNNQFYVQGGPIFIMLGAEWTIDGGWLQSGNMYEMARTHGASMYYTEHRCYGKSYPTSDLSPTSLQYCTTRQALADLANFITELKNAYRSKVVVVGGSYGGNMAIWMREKYPNLVHCAVSSSAPVLAKVDFFEYGDVVYDQMGPVCSALIENAISWLIQIIKSAGGARRVQQDFNLCAPLNVNDPREVQYFFMSLMTIFSGQVQYGTSSSVARVCNNLRSQPGADDYAKFASYVRSQRAQGCAPDYQNFVRYFSSWDLNRGDSRQWIYQTCTQYGYFQTSDSNKSPFLNTVPVDQFYAWCRDIFGQQFTSQVVGNGVAATNAYFGGLNPQTSRVASVQGLVDPWHALGLSESLGPTMPVYIVKDTGHTADLSSPSPADPPEMLAAKRGVQNYIAQWLQEP